MQTKKKKEFNKIVRELNDKLSYTNYLLLEYNDKHIREKIEKKFKNKDRYKHIPCRNTPWIKHRITTWIPE